MTIPETETYSILASKGILDASIDVEM